MKYKKIRKSLYYYFFQVEGSLLFRSKYFLEKSFQFIITLFNGYFNTKIPLIYLFRKDYILTSSFGKFYIKAFSDFDYPIQPYTEDEHTNYWDLQDGDIFIDIGGHVGTYSIKLLQHNKGKNIKTYCFEPQPDTFDFLVKNIQLNNLQENIHPICKGIFSNNGYISFTKTNARNASIAKIIIDDSKVIDQINIEIITLDSFIKESNIDIHKIGLIKIDVEGFEMEVFKGMLEFLSNAKKIKIICEILEKIKYAEIRKFLEERGLSIKNIDDTNYIISSKL